MATALDRNLRRRWIPLGRGVIATMVAAAVIGTNAGFAIVGDRARARPVGGATARTAGGGEPVLIVSGFNSVMGGPEPAPIPGAYDEVRFSYAGVDALGRPLPYTGADTHRSVPDLVRLLAHQVSVLQRRSGRPVAIVAESEGSLIARVYVATEPAAPVARHGPAQSAGPARTGLLSGGLAPRVRSRDGGSAGRV